MKKLAVFTMGTRGDVQPYIYLAQALNAAGYKVTIGTHPCWNKLVADAGVDFAPVGPDINIDYEAAVIRSNTKNPMMSMLKLLKFVFKIVESSSDEVFKLCKGKDLIIVSHCHMGAAEAEKLKIPRVNVTLQTQMLPENRKHSLKEKLLDKLITPQAVKPYNKIRKHYGLKKVKSMDKMMSEKLNLIPISRYVTPQNPLWDERNKVVGYWYSSNDDYVPDRKMSEFLAAGDKPIILALGAMSFESKAEREKLDMFVKAFEKTGTRAIVQGFKKTLEDYKLPETMLAVGSVPHGWLFRQGFAVIHHCGFGTTASAMIYGIPSIPVPHVLDQFLFAEELHKLGVATPPIKAGELTQDKVIAAIEDIRHSYNDYRDTVKELSDEIAQEHGLEKSVAMISDIIEGRA